jgi:hypothetical protein
VVPRWVRSLITAGKTQETRACTNHLIEQCRHVLAATTPLLETMYGTTIMLTALLRAGRFGGVRPPCEAGQSRCRQGTHQRPRSANTCRVGEFGTPFRRRPTVKLPACAKARAADGRPLLTRSGCRKRDTVERAIKRLKQSRAVAARYDKRGYVFHGTTTAAACCLTPHEQSDKIPSGCRASGAPQAQWWLVRLVQGSLRHRLGPPPQDLRTMRRRQHGGADALLPRRREAQDASVEREHAELRAAGCAAEQASSTLAHNVPLTP